MGLVGMMTTCSHVESLFDASAIIEDGDQNFASTIPRSSNDNDNRNSKERQILSAFQSLLDISTSMRI